MILPWMASQFLLTLFLMNSIILTISTSPSLAEKAKSDEDPNRSYTTGLAAKNSNESPFLTKLEDKESLPSPTNSRQMQVLQESFIYT